MGRASRSKRQRREESARKAIRQVSGAQRSRTPLIVVGVVLALALAFGLGWWVNRNSSSGEDVPAQYQVAVSGAVVTAGSSTAPVTVDVYEDYLCSHCERFEARYKGRITRAVNEGRILVRYHQIAILDDATTPPGYSTRAANAALCAAEAGIFPAYHDSLFTHQPRQGRSGLSDDQLVELGTELGAPASFEQCVRGQRHAAQVAAETQAAASNPALLNPQGLFGTPAVTVDGRRVPDLNDDQWLEQATAGR